MHFFATALASIGSFFANMASIGCGFWFLDEEETPKSLIK